MKFRVGIGQDSHKFSNDKNKPLVLAGITIPEARGLEANSDGDVIFHALFNALSSAVGGESIGVYADPMLKQGITNSEDYLDRAYQMVLAEGFEVNNASVSVEALTPHLEGHSNKMIKNIARVIQLDEEAVGLTYTSGEHLTAVGRGEGMQAIAIVSLVD